MNDRITALEKQIEELRNLCDCDCDDDDCVRCAHYPAILEQKNGELDRARAALAASRAAPDCHQPDLVTAAQARIKPLVWVREAPSFWTAKTSIGIYTVYSTPDGYGFGVDLKELGHIGHDADTYPHSSAFDFAKAAAQSDYNSRIAALDLTPAPAVEQVAMTAQDAVRVPETDAERFERANWFWRTMDPDDSADTPSEAIHRGVLGDFCVCEIASSYTGPTRYGFTAPVLDPESDDSEFLHFATQQEAIDAAKERSAALRAIGGDA